VTIRLLWRTDVHLSDVSPVSRKDDWTEAVFAKLDQVKEVARKAKVHAVLDGGDFFNLKSPSRTTHRLVRQAAEHHVDYPCPVYCTPGNHDSVYGNYEYLPQQPLGVLYAAAIFRRLYDDQEALFEVDGVKVRVVGVPYHGTSYDLERFSSIKKGDEDWLVCVAHVLASHQGGTMFENEDVLRYRELASFDPDVYCFLPGTVVTDWNGRALPIEEVGDSLALQGRDGPTMIERVHPIREIDEDVVVLDVEGIPSELIPGVTDEHPFWVAKGLQCCLPSRSGRRCHPDKVRTSHPCSFCHKPPVVVPGWHPAGRIKIGDYVSIPYPKIPSDTVSELGLARLLGYYLAEGHLIENRRKEPAAGVGWSFHAEETDLHADVKRLVREHFGLETKEYSRVKYGNHSLQVCAFGPEIAKFCGEHGGRYSSHKTLSSWVWGLSAGSRVELLVGWMLGDGHARSAKTEAMGGTTSPHLASQMFLLALSVGFRPYYTINPEGTSAFPNGTVSPGLPFHRITFYGDDAEMLSHRMGVTPPKRSKTKVAGFFRDGLFWRRVRGVSRRHYKGPVYNMRTSTEEYVAGLLLTHNCLGHWHKDQGVVDVDGTKIVNIGSMTRGSIAQDDVERRPAISLLTFTKTEIKVQVARLRVRPSEEVFDIESHIRAEARASTMDSFVSSVRETLVDTEGESLEDVVKGAGVPEQVQERAIHYLEMADV